MFAEWMEGRRLATSPENLIKNLLRTPRPGEMPHDPLEPDKFCPVCGMFIGGKTSHHCDPDILRIMQDIEQMPKKKENPEGRKLHKGLKMWNRRLEHFQEWLKKRGKN